MLLSPHQLLRTNWEIRRLQLSADKNEHESDGRLLLTPSTLRDHFHRPSRRRTILELKPSTKQRRETGSLMTSLDHDGWIEA